MRAWLKSALLSVHGDLLLWAPALFGAGIALYFEQFHEPGRGLALVCLVTALVGLVGARYLGEVVMPLGLGLAVLAGGFGWTAWRAQIVAAPVLPWSFHGPIEGRVRLVDRSASGALRVTLDRLQIPHLRARHQPEKLRITLPRSVAQAPPIGARMSAVARLSPPGAPVEPGAFDFQRYAWFQGLGAVGYTRAPPQIVAPPQGQLSALRRKIGAMIASPMSARSGAVARAITVGDRSGITPDLAEPLRQTGLAHLLAISGLHMGLISGAILATLRLVLALPWLRLRVAHANRWAALGALAAAAGYLSVSGGAVSAQRAFIMVGIMLGAVLLDRRAITLRAIAVAALVVLLLRPEALISAGFQMSFAATTALVIVFRGAVSGWGRQVPAVNLIGASLVAGAATAPFAMAHFNMVTSYGLLANLICVPVMSVGVMPAAILATLLSPFGAQDWPLWVMEQGILLILLVAEHVAAWPGAFHMLPSPGPKFLPLCAAGGVALALLHGRAKALCLPVFAAAAVSMLSAQRPAVLVAPGAELVGVMTPNGRALSDPRRSGFAARVWLERDGDPAPQSRAAQRGNWSGHHMLSGERRIIVVDRVRSADLCQEGDILITRSVLMRDLPCMALDAKATAQLGSVALDVTSSGAITLRSASDEAGHRLWNSPGLRWDERLDQ